MGEIVKTKQKKEREREKTGHKTCFHGLFNTVSLTLWFMLRNCAAVVSLALSRSRWLSIRSWASCSHCTTSACLKLFSRLACSSAPGDGGKERVAPPGARWDNDCHLLKPGSFCLRPPVLPDVLGWILHIRFHIRLYCFVSVLMPVYACLGTSPQKPLGLNRLKLYISSSPCADVGQKSWPRDSCHTTPCWGLRRKNTHPIITALWLACYSPKGVYLALTWAVKRDLVSHMSRSVRENGLELLHEGLNISECLSRSTLSLSLPFVWERLQSHIPTCLPKWQG